MKIYKIYLSTKDGIVIKYVKVKDVATEIWLNNDKYPNLIDVIELK